MGSPPDIKSFWSSLITENGISPHTEFLMNIKDVEERGVTLISRVFFLWCMGFKYQREDLEHLFDLIREVLSKSKENTNCEKCKEIKVLLDGRTVSQEIEKNSQRESKSLNDFTNVNSKRKNSPDSSMRRKKLCSRNKENFGKALEQITSNKILALETEPFVEVKSHSEFIIPETVPAEEGIYGNTDFFSGTQNSDEEEEENSPELGKYRKSPILGKFYKSNNSPLANKNKILQPSTHINEIQLTPSRDVKNKRNIAKSPDSVSSSPSLLGCDNVMLITNSEKSDDATSEPKEDFCTPLPKRISPVKKAETLLSTIKYSSTTSSKVEETEEPTTHMGRKLRSSSSSNPLVKFKSEMGGTLAKRRALSRIKTLTSLKDSKPNSELSFEKPGKKKIYRQTKITQDSFCQRINVVKLAGEKLDKGNTNDDDDDDEKTVAKAIEASLQTKEIEDLLRKKRQELKKESPPKKLQESPNKKSLRKSPQTKGQKSLKFGSPSKSDVKLTEDEVLADLGKDEEKIGKTCSRLSRAKKTILHDSFDILPAKDKEPNYAYKGNVARTNSEKQRLDGWECHECRDFYESKDLTDEERKKLQNKCSRHRSKYKPLTNTPEGFWRVGWSDEEES